MFAAGPDYTKTYGVEYLMNNSRYTTKVVLINGYTTFDSIAKIIAVARGINVDTIEVVLIRKVY